MFIIYFCITMYCEIQITVIQCITEVITVGISIRVTKKESELIKKYAELQGKSVSEIMRKAVLEKIEDEFDIYIYGEAKKDYETNAKVYTIAEAKKILGIE